jgi:hypothetical protein
LTDGPEADVPFASASGDTQLLSGRASRARFLGLAVVRPDFVRRPMPISGRKLSVSDSTRAKPVAGLESARAGEMMSARSGPASEGSPAAPSVLFSGVAKLELGWLGREPWDAVPLAVRKRFP